MNSHLHWDAIYEIVIALIRNFPNQNLEALSLQDIYQMTIKLDGFEDDISLANDEILMAIYQEWFEEINPL
jgi:FeS assembly protein IscX